MCIFSLISFLWQELFAVSISKVIIRAWFPVSSVWKWSVAVFWRNTFHILLLFLYAFPPCIKQWCPASHCSLLSHLLKREGPMCPQKTFTTSVKSSSSGYVQQEEHAKRVSLPGQDTLPSFLNPSLQQAPGYRRTRMAVGGVAPLLNYRVQGLRDLIWITRPAAGCPFHEVWLVLT